MTSAPYGHAVLLPFLEGLLPENRATRQRWAQRLGVSGDDAFALFSRMGWDCPGAIQLCNPDELSEVVLRNADVKRVFDVEIGDRLRALSDDSASWSLPDEHWSLPGQQDKFTLVSRDGEWHEARGASATTHIVKPGIGRLHDQALVEHVTMRAAALVDITKRTSARPWAAYPARSTRLTRVRRWQTWPESSKETARR